MTKTIKIDDKEMAEAYLKIINLYGISPIGTYLRAVNLDREYLYETIKPDGTITIHLGESND